MARSSRGTVSVPLVEGMAQLVKHAPPQQLLFDVKNSVNISSGFAFYNKDIIGWCTFYQFSLANIPSKL